MADPHHVEALDGFDRGTVAAYRAGLVVAAAGVAGGAAAAVDQLPGGGVVGGADDLPEQSGRAPALHPHPMHAALLDQRIIAGRSLKLV